MSETPTVILERLTEGDERAADRLMPLIYDELRGLAAHYLRDERSDHTLQPTALVHEAYLRIVEQDGVHWKNRAHFFALAAEMIRRILVDHARAKKTVKRGGDRDRIALSEAEQPSNGGVDVLVLDELLDELSGLSDRQRRVVELRFFGGLSVKETAHVLGISEPTVKADWRVARAWLGPRLQR